MKMIHGLKQSSRVWFEISSIVIAGIGFQCCHYDHFVFLQQTISGIVLAVYVNDILLTEK